MKDQFIGINIKQKPIIKIQQTNLDFFLNQILLEFFVGVLVYTNQDVASRKFKAKRYYFPKGIIDNYNVIINGKNFYDQTIDSDIKRYEEIRKLKTWQGEDYTTGCLLDYEYVKKHYRLTAVDLSGQRELDADPKAIQQIELVGQLKKLNDDDNVESMFILKILEKIKEARLKFSQGSVTV